MSRGSQHSHSEAGDKWRSKGKAGCRWRGELLRIQDIAELWILVNRNRNVKETSVFFWVLGC